MVNTMTRVIPILFIICYFLICNAFAASMQSVKRGDTCKYYVSNLGLDVNTGLTASVPWKTVEKVNSFSFSPGEVVCFKRSNVWGETLTPSVSGSRARPIIFTAYGGGLNPIFDGNGTLANGVLVAESFLHFKNLIIRSSTSNGFFVNTGSTYTYAIKVKVINSAGNGFLIRGDKFTCIKCEVFGSGNFGLSLNLGTGHKVIDIKSHHNKKHGIFISSDICVVNGGDFYNNGSVGLEGSGVALFGSNFTKVTNAIARENSGNGFNAIFSGIGDPTVDAVFESNTAFGNSTLDDVTVGPASGIRLDTDTTGAIVLNNKSFDNESGGIVCEDGCNNSRIEGNEVYRNSSGMAHSNNPAGANNLFKNNFSHDNILDGFTSPSSPNPVILDGNTFINNGRYGIDCQCVAHTLSGNTVSGNAMQNIINCP